VRELVSCIIYWSTNADEAMPLINFVGFSRQQYIDCPCAEMVAIPHGFSLSDCINFSPCGLAAFVQAYFSFPVLHFAETSNIIEKQPQFNHFKSYICIAAVSGNYQ
jgi:hypothetical protein